MYREVLITRDRHYSSAA